MDFVRGVFLFGLVAMIATFNAKLNMDQSAILIWSKVSDDQWSRQCTYYAPFRVFKHEVPVGAVCAGMMNLRT